MKRLISILIAMGIISTVVLTGCSNDDGDAKKIGVLQLVEHSALDEAYRGFKDGLKEGGYEEGKEIKISYQNAQGSQTNAVTIADKLVNERNDLILAIATPGAQAVANKTKDIPILITAVTDPSDAGLVNSNERPDTNVTGTSDLNPIKEQIGLIKDFVPNAKKVGILYSSSEANSKYQANIAKEELKAMGMEGIDYTASNTNEIQLVVQSMVGKVDAVYIPTDNLVVSSISIVTKILNENKIPSIVSEVSVVKSGGLATYGIDYYNLGKQTAQMAIDILRNGKSPKDMAIQYSKDNKLVINKTVLSSLGLTMPLNLIGKAEIVE